MANAMHIFVRVGMVVLGVVLKIPCMNFPRVEFSLLRYIYKLYFKSIFVVCICSLYLTKNCYGRNIPMEILLLISNFGSPMIKRRKGLSPACSRRLFFYMAERKGFEPLEQCFAHRSLPSKGSAIDHSTISPLISAYTFHLTNQQKP